MIGLKNASAIARSIRNIVMTAPGEKFFDPNFGSHISQTAVLKNLDILTAVAIKDEIENSIRNYEPRVILDNVWSNQTLITTHMMQQLSIEL